MTYRALVVLSHLGFEVPSWPIHKTSWALIDMIGFNTITSSIGCHWRLKTRVDFEGLESCKLDGLPLDWHGCDGIGRFSK